MDQIMDGYVRVSRVQGREGEGYIPPHVQREAIERWAEYKGITIGEWLVDEDQSGGTQNRPELRRGIQRALNGETAGIVSWKIDRFSRTTEGGLTDLRRLQEAGARLAFVVEDIDSGTTYGKMVYTILLAVSEAFLENIKSSWVDAKKRAVGRGAYISRTPFGYLRNADGTLRPNPEIGPHVTEAFRLAGRFGLRSAMDYLTLHAPERGWTTTKARRLLSGRAYLGETRNGEHVQAGTHEPLVSRAAWEAAQSAPISRRPSDVFVLSGLLRCANCSQPMTGSRGGHGQRTYRCSGTQAQAIVKCDRGVVVTADRVETYVRDVVSELVSGLSVHVGAGVDPELSALEHVLEEAEVELQAFASDLTMRRALGDAYHGHLDERVNAVADAKAAYRERAKHQQARTVLDMSAVDSDDPEMFRALLGALFQSVRVRPGRGVKIEARVDLVPFEADGPTRIADTQQG